jgi:hypothetical protein
MGRLRDAIMPQMTNRVIAPTTDPTRPAPPPPPYHPRDCFKNVATKAPAIPRNCCEDSPSLPNYYVPFVAVGGKANSDPTCRHSTEWDAISVENAPGRVAGSAVADCARQLKESNSEYKCGNIAIPGAIPGGIGGASFIL